jgi:hypothetical protein
MVALQNGERKDDSEEVVVNWLLDTRTFGMRNMIMDTSVLLIQFLTTPSTCERLNRVKLPWMDRGCLGAEYVYTTTVFLPRYFRRREANWTLRSSEGIFSAQVHCVVILERLEKA